MTKLTPTPSLLSSPANAGAGDDQPADERSDQTLGVARRRALVAQLEHAGHDQRDAGDDEDRPDDVAVLPQVVVADPRGGEDLAARSRSPSASSSPSTTTWPANSLAKLELGADQHEEACRA